MSGHEDRTGAGVTSTGPTGTAPTGTAALVPAGGRALPPTSAFAGDDGTADPALTEALTRHGAGRADVAEVVRAFAPTRVLVPVTAEAEECGITPEGLEVDREASAGVVALRAPDGRTALPVFTSVAAMTAWSGEVRPVPAQAPRAARSALEEGWELVVIDPGGPVTVVVPHPAVRALAEGRAWEPAVRDGVVRPDVAAAVAALAQVPAVVAAVAEPGRTAEVRVVLSLAPGLGRAALDAVVAQVNAALAADALIAECDSLELAVVAAD